MAFTMSTLKPGKRYLVNVSGVNVDNPIADSTGMIQISYSTWPAVFTVVEDVSTPTPTPSPSPTVSPTPQPGTPVSGDLNGDGVVNETDLNIVDINIGKTTSIPYPNYDANANGIVDIFDMRLVAKNAK